MLTRGTTKSLAAPVHLGLWIWDCHRGAGDGFPAPSLILGAALTCDHNPDWQKTQSHLHCREVPGGFTIDRPSRREQQPVPRPRRVLCRAPPQTQRGRKSLSRTGSIHPRPRGSRAAATHLLGYLRKMSLMTTMASCTT